MTTGAPPPSTHSPVVIDTGPFHLTPAEHVRVMAATPSFRRVTLIISVASLVVVGALVAVRSDRSALVLAPLLALMAPLAWLAPTGLTRSERRWRVRADGLVEIDSSTITYRGSLAALEVEPVRRVGNVVVVDEQRFVLPSRVLSAADQRRWDDLATVALRSSSPYVAFTDDPDRTLPYCSESAAEWFPMLHRRRVDQGVRSSAAILTETGIRTTERAGVREWQYGAVSRVRDRRSGLGFRAGGVPLFVPAHGFRDREHQRGFAARLRAGPADRA